MLLSVKTKLNEILGEGKKWKKKNPEFSNEANQATRCFSLLSVAWWCVILIYVDFHCDRYYRHIYIDVCKSLDMTVDITVRNDPFAPFACLMVT